MASVKHPDVTVQLSGGSGNAISIVGNVSKALKRAGVPQSEVNQFRDEALSGDYDHVLQTCMKWVHTR